jgi:hypothetical protein
MLTAGLSYSGGVVYFALKSQVANGGWMALSNNAFWPHRDVYLPIIFRHSPAFHRSHESCGKCAN